MAKFAGDERHGSCLQSAFAPGYTRNTRHLTIFEFYLVLLPALGRNTYSANPFGLREGVLLQALFVDPQVDHQLANPLGLQLDDLLGRRVLDHSDIAVDHDHDGEKKLCRGHRDYHISTLRVEEASR